MSGRSVGRAKDIEERSEREGGTIPISSPFAHSLIQSFIQCDTADLGEGGRKEGDDGGTRTNEVDIWTAIMTDSRRLA